MKPPKDDPDKDNAASAPPPEGSEEEDDDRTLFMPMPTPPAAEAPTPTPPPAAAPAPEDDRTNIQPLPTPRTPETVAPNPPAEIGIGTLVNNNYEITHILSSGGMGSVYRGVEIGTGDPVAIKAVLPELAEDEKLACCSNERPAPCGNCLMRRLYVITTTSTTAS